MISQHNNWCRGLFNSLIDGGVWGVPRSGLTFQRKGDEFRLLDRMPFQEGIAANAAEWESLQDADYETIKEEFEKAGIPVRKGTK